MTSPLYTFGGSSGHRVDREGFRGGTHAGIANMRSMMVIAPTLKSLHQR